MSRAERLIAERLGSAVQSKQRLGGGDFAEANRCVLADGRQVFVKSHLQPPEFFFSTEAAGLDWLHSTGTVNIPKVLLVCDDPPLLVLDWVDQGRGDNNTEANLGRQLAELHQQPFYCFGRPDDRSTGSLALPNSAKPSWVEFYAENRLLPLAKLSYERATLPTHDIKGIEKLAADLSKFVAADTQPSLLHGDLWAGNRLVDRQAQSWLIDPAAHGGHREFDLAMMRLFGGYGDACFAAYDEAFRLDDDWQHRISLHQLAPLIVHAIKFGGHYVAAVHEALQAYL